MLLLGKEEELVLLVIGEAQFLQVLVLGFGETFSLMEEAQGADVGSGEV